MGLGDLHVRVGRGGGSERGRVWGPDSANNAERVGPLRQDHTCVGAGEGGGRGGREAQGGIAPRFDPPFGPHLPPSP